MADISVTLVLDDSQYTAKLTQAQAAAQAFGQNTTKTMTDATAAIQKVMSALSGLSSNFTSLNASINATAQTMNNFGASATKNSNQAVGSLNQVSDKLKGLTGAFSLTATVSFTEELLKMSNITHNLGESMGIGTSSMLQLGAAGIAMGKDIQSVGMMMERMVSAADQAEDGNMKLRQAFGQVGISMKDLNTLAPDELFKKVANALAEMDDPAQRARISMELFGRGAMGMDWAKYSSELIKASKDLTDHALAVDNAAEDYNKLQAAINTFKLNFLSAYGPVITTIVDFTAKMMDSKAAIAAVYAAMVGGLLFAIKAVAAAFLEAETVAAVFMGALAPELALIVAAIGLVAAGIGAAFNTDLVESFTNKIKDLLGLTTELKDEFGKFDQGTGSGWEGKLATSSKPALDPNAAKTAELQGVLARQLAANTAAQERLKLEISLVGASEDLRKSRLAAFDEDVKVSKEMETNLNKIKVLQLEMANNPTHPDYGPEISALQQQNKLLLDQYGAMGPLTEAFIQAQQAQKLKVLYSNQELEVATKLKDIQQQIAAIGGGRQGQGETAGITAMNKAIEAAQKLREEQLARKLNEQEFQEILTREQAAYKPLIAAEQALADAKARQAINVVSSNQEEDVIKRIKDLRVAMAELTMSTQQKELANIEKIANAQTEQLDKALKANYGDAWLLQTDAVAEYNKALDKSVASMKELTDATNANLAKSKEFSTGWTQASNQFIDDATNNATVGKQLFQGMTDGVIKAIDGMVSHGKFSFKDLFASLLMDIMNAQLRQAMLGIMGMFGNQAAGQAALSGGGLFSGIGAMLSGFGANGGVSTSIMDAGVSSGSSLASGTMFASGGGTIGSGQMAIVGEAGPELVKGPANVTSNSALNNLTGGGTTVNHNYTIQAVDAKSVAQLFYENRMTVYGTVQQAQKELPFRSAQPQY